jgi:hypothetical protein
LAAGRVHGPVSWREVRVGTYMCIVIDRGAERCRERAVDSPGLLWGVFGFSVECRARENLDRLR